MSQLDLRDLAPAPDQLWLSRPPYLLIARVLAVDEAPDGSRVVSYRLYDDDGFVLEQVEHAALDAGWWQAFQPLKRRYG
ncbi:MAG TPA: hypothetical protein VIT85_05525 [Solirubrobacterales bacterium]